MTEDDFVIDEMSTVSRNKYVVEKKAVYNKYNWREILKTLFISRYIDLKEEKDLHPKRMIYNQFSARGHDLAQILLASRLTHAKDAASGYYRSRPFLLSVGLSVEDAFSGPLARSGGLSDGRDIGVVFNLPGEMSKTGITVLPMQGGVGAQYTPVAGWAQSIRYYRDVLKIREYDEAIAVSLGGDASVVTNGFWAALTNATTLNLPQLFYIEDNGYGISVPSYMQIPDGDIVANLSSFKNLKKYSGDGTDPVETAKLVDEAVSFVRKHRSPALLRLKVPRLCGHTGQDTQTYKSKEEIIKENESDPIIKLKKFLVPNHITNGEWDRLEDECQIFVEQCFLRAQSRKSPSISNVKKFVFSEHNLSSLRNSAALGHVAPFDENCRFKYKPEPKGSRINMVSAIRFTLDSELRRNQKVMVFGQDVGKKGGVHSATVGLQEKYGCNRVFDTNLSEEGIIGRAVGMAYAGLKPIPEIQFRKYADSAAEQIHDCGTVRWRTANRFSAPIVLRMPVGFSKRGDLWHAQCNEAEFIHSVGWKVAFPSNAEDAVGLLRMAIQSDDPVVFFEHRFMMDSAWARRQYPGDDYVISFGRARIVSPGDDLTIVCWGALVEECVAAAENSEFSIEVIDLRTLAPWDSEMVFTSVSKTGRCLIVHEDNLTAGFGAELAAQISLELFSSLKIPIDRMSMPDIPCPHNIDLLNSVLPNRETIDIRIDEMLKTREIKERRRLV